MPDLSVIICTHNPRPDYLRRVLDALKAQTLPKELWELLLIDNASRESLAQHWDLSWHPEARHVREDELGLTPARLRGIRESTGDNLVFVDDDNVLDTDYLAQAISIFEQWPMLGAIGAGVSKGEFEIPPPDWITPYLSGLVISELDRNYWSNYNDWSGVTVPFGAGMAVRRQVADDYAQKATKCSLRRLLDRTGPRMISGGDSDMALCAMDLGMGTGRFIPLRLTHLIPKSRLTEDYIIRVNAGIAESSEILSFIRKGRWIEHPIIWKQKLRYFIYFFKKRGMARSIWLASAKARAEARKQIAQLNS
jgi:glycosyltransferase involved in cell wall biosynthesis